MDRIAGIGHCWSRLIRSIDIVDPPLEISQFFVEVAFFLIADHIVGKNILENGSDLISRPRGTGFGIVSEKSTEIPYLVLFDNAVRRDVPDEIQSL